MNTSRSIMYDKIMQDNRSILHELYNRELGYSNEYVKECALLRNVQGMKPVFELRHNRPRSPGDIRNDVCKIRYSCNGNMLASSFYYGDRIDFWEWAEDRLFLSMHVGSGCALSRFEWLPYDTERLLLAVDKFGHMRMVDLETESSNFLLYVRSPGLSYDLHSKLPHCVTVADEAGAVSTMDFRTGHKTSIIRPSTDPSTTFDIQWLGINPQRYHEFCIAGETDELRIFDRRSTIRPIYRLSTMSSTATNPFKDFDEVPNTRNSVLDLSTNSRRSYNVKLSYNYNGTKLIACCALDSVLLFDTTMSYPIGRYAIDNVRLDEPSTSTDEPSTSTDTNGFGPGPSTSTDTNGFGPGPSTSTSTSTYTDTDTDTNGFGPGPSTSTDMNGFGPRTRISFNGLGPSTSDSLDKLEPSAINRNNIVKCFKHINFMGPKSEYVVATALVYESSTSNREIPGMYFWHTHSQKLVKAVEIPDRNCALGIHPSGPILATSLDERGIRLWS